MTAYIFFFQIEDQHHALQKLATERDEVDRNYEEIMRKVQRMDLEYDRLTERASKLEATNQQLTEENREYKTFSKIYRNSYGNFKTVTI